MEYKTPGVYIREVDSGPKPIESVSTAIPGFLGLFEFNPPSDATAITSTDGARQLQGKVAPQLGEEQCLAQAEGDAKAEGNQESRTGQT